MTHDLNELNARIDRLERAARRWKRIGIAASIGVGVLALAGAAVPAMCDVVTGERLVLRDEGGRARVTIDAYHTETPAIAFQDKAGKVRARFGLDADGEACVTIFDGKGALKSTHRFDAQPATGGEGKGQPQKKTGEGDPAVAMR